MKKRFSPRPYDLFIVAYVFFVGILVLFFGHGVHLRWLIVFLHAVGVLFVAFLVLFHDESKRVWGFLRELYPIFFLPAFYEEMRFTDHMFFKGCLDAHVVRLEGLILGFHPNLAVSRLYNPILTELMTIFYFSYYFMVLIPPFVLYKLGRKQDLSLFLSAVMLSYCVSFTLSTIFPVESPRFFLSGYIKLPEGYVITKLHDMFMAFGSFKGNGMPSSHVAATFSSVLAMKDISKKWFWIMFPTFILMCFSTVYGCYHYALDVLGGLFVGLLAYVTVIRVFRTRLGSL